jgi:uncharacterized protein (UPF0548 family)
VLRLRRPSPSALEQLLVTAKNTRPSYPEVGATRDDHMPAGYRHDRDTTLLEPGDEVFERAVSALRKWRVQAGAGIEVVPDDAWVNADETVVLLIRVRGFWALAPCRVVYIEQAQNSFAFAYGTLPGHPESGEVAFRIERGGAGVRFSVTSFSRPADLLGRAASPLTRRLQRRVTLQYLEAMRAALGKSQSVP